MKTEQNRTEQDRTEQSKKRQKEQIREKEKLLVFGLSGKNHWSSTTRSSHIRARATMLQYRDLSKLCVPNV